MKTVINIPERLCPLRSFKPCILERCAWWYASECAIASLGFVDHTLQRFPGVEPPHEEEGDEHAP